MPTPVFCCGAECGITTVGASITGANVHWDVKTGSPTIVSALRGSGSRAYSFPAAGSACDLRKTISNTPTVAVARAYISFTSLPNLTCNVFGFFTASSNFVGVRFNPTGNVLEGVGGATAGGSFAVSQNTVYRVDIRCTVSATLLCEWRVDGVAQTNASGAGTSTFNSFRIGVGVSGSPAVTGTMAADDIIFTQTSADYPIGASTIKGLFPRADGTHNFLLAGNFKYNNSTNVATSATDVYSYLDDLLDNITDFIAAANADAGEYIEVLPQTFQEAVTSINGLEIVGAHHAAGTAANKQSLHILDGNTESAVFDDADLSQTSICYTSKHYAVAPSTAAAWTRAKVEALKLRWASTFGTTEDIIPVPYLDGLCIEVDYVPTPTPTVQMALASGLMCFEVRNLITVTVGSLPTVGTSGGASLIRPMGLYLNANRVHRFMRGEGNDK